MIYNQKISPSPEILKDTVSPDITIVSDKLSYNADEYIRITRTLTNTSESPIETFWGTCADSYQYFVDNQEVYQFKGTCFIGPSNLNPQESISKPVILNFSKIKPGKHSFFIVSGATQSNTLSFETADTRTVGDCYNYNQDITPQCTQLVIHTNVSSVDTGDNATRCARIKAQFIDNTQLLPIPTLSTITCDGSKPAYFVMNIPPKDFAYHKKRLENASPESEIITSMITLDILDLVLKY